MEMTIEQEEILFEHIDELNQDLSSMSAEDLEECSKTMVKRTEECLEILQDIRENKKN